MKTELKIDTESIANHCAVSAKNSGGKISAYHLTLVKPFIEALGIHPGDNVDIAILQVNRGLPKTSGPADVGTSVETNILDSTQTMHPEIVQKESLRRSTKTPKSKRLTGGRRGKSKRGKRGK